MKKMGKRVIKKRKKKGRREEEGGKEVVPRVLRSPYMPDTT